MSKFLKLVQENTPGEEAGKGPFEIKIEDAQGNFMAKVTVPDSISSWFDNFLEFVNKIGGHDLEVEKGPTLPVEDDELKDKIENILGKDIEYWLPYIIVDNISADQDFDRYKVTIKLDFRVTEAGANRTITVLITPERAFILEEKQREEFILKPQETGFRPPSEERMMTGDSITPGGYGASMY